MPRRRSVLVLLAIAVIAIAVIATVGAVGGAVGLATRGSDGPAVTSGTDPSLPAVAATTRRPDPVQRAPARPRAARLPDATPTAQPVETDADQGPPTPTQSRSRKWPDPTHASREPPGTQHFDSWRRWWSVDGAVLLARQPAQRDRRRSGTDITRDEDARAALRGLLADTNENFDVRSAAALALAKWGDRESAGRLVRLARAAYDPRALRESAVVALGLLGEDTPEVRDCLTDCLRKPCTSASYVSPFAAVALALVAPSAGADDWRIGSLFDVLTSRADAKDDLRSAAAFALGILAEPSSADRLVALAEAPDSQRPATAVRCAILDALGMIGAHGLGDPGRLARLCAALEGALSDTSSETVMDRRSAALALGRVAAVADPETQRDVAGRLGAFAVATLDAQSRGFALLSVGRIAAATGDAQLWADCTRALTAALERHDARPFAALALGLVARADVAARRSPSGIQESLRTALAASEFKDERSALLLACGLAADPVACDEMDEVLGNGRESSVVLEAAALGLGLAGATGRGRLAERMIEVSERRLMLTCASAARVLGDGDAVDGPRALLAVAEESQYVIGNTLLALGELRDAEAVPAMLKIALNAREFPDLTRAIAVVAIGQIGDPRAVPRLAELFEGTNYRAWPPALLELSTIR